MDASRGVRIQGVPTGNKANLIVFEAILKDILNNKAASLSEGNFMPHSPQRLVDILHDLRRVSRPTEFE